MNDTLVMRTSGVIKFIINDKKRDSSLFTFNTQKELKVQMLKTLREKIADFMSWYSDFKNIEDIHQFELFTTDVGCTSHCTIPMGTSFTVIGNLFTANEVQKILNEEAAKRNLKVKVKVSEY